MDTLVIVRKIREAEALAESGKHREARKLLEPLLAQNGLSDSHRGLISKKIEVFEKQLDRATRVMSRRANDSSRRDPSDDTDLGSGRKPALSAGKPLSSGDTTVERPAIAPGAPTEEVPRPRDPRDKDTTKLRKKVEPEKPKGNTTLADRDLVSLYDSPDAVRGETTVRDRPAPVKPPSERRVVVRPAENTPAAKNGATRQIDTEIPPRAPSNRLKSASGSDLGAPAAADLAPLHEDAAEIRIVDSPLPPSAPAQDAPKPAFARHSDESQEIEPVQDEGFDSDEMPALGEIAPPKPAGDTRGLYKALHAEPAPRQAQSVRVQDSLVAASPESAPASSEKSRSARSNKDLTNMVERLPDDDLRKELALEVVRLREELEKAKSGRRDTDKTSAGSSRRIAPGEKPESSMFRIPSNRVNTIVRTAAGTSDITAHMPTRDENVPELEVMRRDTLKKQPENGALRDSRISLAQNYLENARPKEAERYKLLATALGLLVVVGLVAWAIYWAVSVVSAQQAQ